MLTILIPITSTNFPHPKLNTNDPVPNAKNEKFIHSLIPILGGKTKNY
jgi:hypothetical protein